MEELIPKTRGARAQLRARVGWWTASLLALLSGTLALVSYMRWFEPIAIVEPDPADSELAEDMLAEPTTWVDADEEAWFEEDENWAASDDDDDDELEAEEAPTDPTAPIWIGGSEPDPVDQDRDGIDHVRALIEDRRADVVEPSEDDFYDDPSGDGAVAFDEGGSTHDSSALASDEDPPPPRFAPAVLARLLLREAVILALGIVLLALQRLERDRSSAIAGAFFVTAALLRAAGFALPVDGSLRLYTASESLTMVACGTALWTARRGRLPLFAILVAVYASAQLPWQWGLSLTGPVALAQRVGPWVLLAIAFTDRGRAQSEASVVPVAAGPYRAAAPRPPVHDVSWAPVAVLCAGAAWLATATLLRLLEPSYEDAWRHPDAYRAAADLGLAVAAAVAAGRAPAGGARRAFSMAAAFFAALPLSREVVIRVVPYGQIAATLVACALLAPAIIATLVALERLARDHGRTEGRAPASLHPAELAMVIAGAIALPWVVGPSAPPIGVGWLFLAVVVASAGIFWQAVRRVARQNDDREPAGQPEETLETDVDAHDDDDEHPSTTP